MDEDFWDNIVRLYEELDYDCGIAAERNKNEIQDK